MFLFFHHKSPQPRPSTFAKAKNARSSAYIDKTSFSPKRLRNEKRLCFCRTRTRQALSEIKDYIQNLDPIDFQKLVAALLRAMGYHTPFISPRGKDGGVDIIAYSDPLGLKEPRIKVQVKRYSDTDKVTAKDVRSLLGILTTKESALFVTSGYYTPDAEAAAKDKNICLIDGNKFINLWQEFYPKMSDEDKDRLPLKYVAFLGKEE